MQRRLQHGLGARTRLQDEGEDRCEAGREDEPVESADTAEAAKGVGEPGYTARPRLCTYSAREARRRRRPEVEGRLRPAARLVFDRRTDDKVDSDRHVLGDEVARHRLRDPRLSGTHCADAPLAGNVRLQVAAQMRARGTARDRGCVQRRLRPAPSAAERYAGPQVRVACGASGRSAASVSAKRSVPVFGPEN